MRLRFAGCTIDLDARRLFRGPEPVHLSPKAFETLRVLIENRPAAVSKADLLERVWPGVFVSDASLARVINEVRQAVGDTARAGGVIRTIHTYGYAFAADVDHDAEVPPAAREFPRTFCLLVSGTRTELLHEGDQVVGRDPTSDIWIDSPKVSWRHSRLVVSHGAVTIEDLGSKNGTFVRETRIGGPVALEDGDELRIGRVRCVFRIQDARGLTETDPGSRDR